MCMPCEANAGGSVRLLFSGSDRFKIDRARVLRRPLRREFGVGESMALLPHDFRVTVFKSRLGLDRQKLRSSRSTFVIRIIQLAKVIPHRRQAQRLGKSVAMTHEGLREESPKFLALSIQHAQLQHDARQ